MARLPTAATNFLELRKAEVQGIAQLSHRLGPDAARVGSIFGAKIRSERRGDAPTGSQNKSRPLRITTIPSVAGCTTGSLCPRCPYIRDEVLSLYSKPRFCLQGAHYSRCHESSVLWSTMCPRAQSRGVVKAKVGKVARERWFLLASTASFQRLAAHLPGLVCPYRQ